MRDPTERTGAPAARRSELSSLRRCIGALVFLTAVVSLGCADADVSTVGASCPSGGTQCGARCVDVAVDKDHCGACGSACGSGVGCFAGRCESPARLRVARDGHALVLGADGRIFAIGGSDSRDGATPRPIASVEIYDPETNRWSDAPDLPGTRVYLGAGLRGGEIWAVGGGSTGDECPSGQAGDGCARPEVWTFSAAGIWAPADALSIARVDFGLAASAGGTLRAIGGVDEPQRSGMDVIADVAWELQVGARGRYGNRIVTARNGKIFAVGGGVENASPPTDNVDVYDPGSGHWDKAGALKVPRGLGGVAVGLDGRIYYAGGVDVDSAALASVEIYDPTTDAWALDAVAPMPETRLDTQAVTTSDGRIFVVGGSTFKYFNVVDGVLVYDPARDEWYR